MANKYTIIIIIRRWGNASIKKFTSLFFGTRVAANVRINKKKSQYERYNRNDDHQLFRHTRIVGCVCVLFCVCAFVFKFVLYIHWEVNDPIFGCNSKKFIWIFFSNDVIFFLLLLFGIHIKEWMNVIFFVATDSQYLKIEKKKKKCDGVVYTLSACTNTNNSNQMDKKILNLK